MGNPAHTAAEKDFLNPGFGIEEGAPSGLSRREPAITKGRKGYHFDFRQIFLCHDVLNFEEVIFTDHQLEPFQ